MTQNPPELRPAHRFRARRLRAQDMNLGVLAARGRHGSLGVITAAVLDVSYYGVALQVNQPSSEGEVVLSGDRLEDLTITDVEGNNLFHGAAVIRRVSDRDNQLVIGVEFEAAGLDLGELYRRGTRRSFGERWKDVINRAEQGGISPEFKAWVLDLRTDLERIRDFLDAEEKALESVDEMSRREALNQYLAEVTPVLNDRMTQAARELTLLVRGVPDDQEAAWRNFIRSNLVHLIDRSPFMKRALHKPLGYAGDYEMMNMLYRDHAEGSSLFGKAMNVWVTQEAAAQANINRIELLQSYVQDALAAKPEARVRIASIGCGPAHEIASILQRCPELGPRLDVALIDQEERSIAFCERTLSPLANRTGARIQFIRESIRRLLVAKELSRALGQRELVYSAGLFDYLNERSFNALLAALYETVVPGGVLAVGNVAINNPSRAIMEYFYEWFLIHRSREDLLQFAERLRPGPARMEVRAEPLGLNLFLTVRK